MTVHQQDSVQPQQSQDSPQPMGLGLTMEETEEVVLVGMAVRLLACLGLQVSVSMAVAL